MRLRDTGRIQGGPRPTGIDLPVKTFMRDNDGKFRDSGFDGVIESTGATIKRKTSLSPNLRAHEEQLIQTLKFEIQTRTAVRQ